MFGVLGVSRRVVIACNALQSLSLSLASLFYSVHLDHGSVYGKTTGLKFNSQHAIQSSPHQKQLVQLKLESHQRQVLFSASYPVVAAP